MEQLEEVASTLSHDELLEITQSSLCTLLTCDSLLSDLPSDIILEEVLSQIAVEYGQAMTVIISREAEPPLKVVCGEKRHSALGGVSLSHAQGRIKVTAHWNPPASPRVGINCWSTDERRVDAWGLFNVPQNATVRDLKKAIARHFEIYQKRTGSKVKISWKYVWRTYDLNYDGIILDTDISQIGDYGVTNKVVLTFKKRKNNRKK